eukprot:scaffold259_cov158-Amphora_coffeaeformis.AAC.10
MEEVYLAIRMTFCGNYTHEKVEAVYHSIIHIQLSLRDRISQYLIEVYAPFFTKLFYLTVRLHRYTTATYAALNTLDRMSNYRDSRWNWNVPPSYKLPHSNVRMPFQVPQDLPNKIAVQIVIRHSL